VPKKTRAYHSGWPPKFTFLLIQHFANLSEIIFKLNVGLSNEFKGSQMSSRDLWLDPKSYEISSEVEALPIEHETFHQHLEFLINIGAFAFSA
jgi:hypothetical protein